MAVFSNTRIALRHLLATLMNDQVTGVVASPGSGSFVCASTDWERSDDFFNDFVEVYCYSGTGIGTSGKPTNWVNATHTLSFLPAATLTVADLVEVHRRFTVEEYNRAINHAIDQVAMDALVDRVDESITLTSGTYQYNLPTQFLYIDDLWISDVNGDWVEQLPLDQKYWRPVKKSTLLIEFIKERYSPLTSHKVRIVGMASPSILDTDAETTPIDPEYIIQAAKAFLHQSRIRGADKDSEFHAQQMQIAATLASGSRREMQTNRTGVAIVEA
tara:strand:+ start:82 stop:900 length:819 start_codon:yes stop_codon:yes gene_type:complete